jgi:hypothetical protein
MALGDFVASQINEGIGAYIRKANVDPLENLFQGRQPLGEIDLGLPVAVTLDYSAEELTGLSTLALHPKVHLGSVDWPALIAGGERPVKGSFSASAEFQTVAAKLHGGLEASFGEASPRVDLDGSLTIEGLAAVLKGELAVTGKGSLTDGIQVCLISVDVKELALTHEAVHIHLEDLGAFNHLVDHVVEVIETHVTNVVGKGLDSVLRTVVNGGINSLLPICREFHPEAAIEEAGKDLLNKISGWFGG